MDLSKQAGEYLTNGWSYNPVQGFTPSDFTLILQDGTRYGMDPRGEAAWIDDRHGNRVTYMDNGISHSNGRSVTFQRDTEGRITRVTDPAGHSIVYSYDPATGDLVAVTDRTNATTEFSYDPDHPHFLAEAIDALGRTAAHVTYDAQGRILDAMDATGAKTGYGYNPGTRVQEVEDPSGGSVSQTLDRRGNVTRETGADGSLIVRTYDSRDRLLTETRVVGQEDNASNGQHDDQTTRYSYNSLGQPVTTTNARGERTRNTYDQYGQLLTSTDPLGNTTTSEYDPTGSLTSITTAGRQTSFTYDAAGNVTEVKDHAGNVLVTNQYDPWSQLSETTSATGQSTHFEYDALGNRTASWHVRQAFQPDGTPYDVQIREETDYDANAHAIATRQVVIDRPGTPQQSTRTLWTTSTKYNVVGQVERSVDRFGNATESTYDKRALQIQTRTASRCVSEEPGQPPLDRWLVSRTVFDAAGRALYQTDQYVEGATDPIWGTHTVYDAAGRVTRTERVKGLVISLTGTAPNLESVLIDGGTVVSANTTEYDGQGRVEKTVNQYGAETRTTYNTFGDVIQTATETRSVSEGVWLVSRSVYDDHGRAVFRLDQVAAPDPIPAELTGLGTHTVYDTQGRVTKTERAQSLAILLTSQLSTFNSQLSSPGTLVSKTETIYNAKGQVARTIAADGQVTDYEYDSLGRQVATIGHAVPAASVALPASLKSQISNPQSTLVRLRTETDYDEQGRVGTQRSNVIVVEDAAGNLLDTLYQAQQQTSYEYDAYGNRVKTIFADGSFVLVRYDDFGRQVAEAQQVAAGTQVAWSEPADSFVVPPSGGSPDVVIPTKLFEYDTQGRLSAVELPAVPDPQDLDANDDAIVKRPRYEYAYDARGNQTRIRDPLIRETWFTFDIQGHQLTRTLPLGFGLDGVAGTPDDSAVSEGDFTERFEYDDLGRQTLYISFEGVVTAFQYDTDDGLDAGDAGRLVAKRYFQTLAGYQTWRADQDDGAPYTVNPDELWTYAYDAFGRQTHVVVSLRDTVTGELTVHRTETTTYDAQGRIITATSPEGTIHYEYDLVTGQRTRTEATTLVGDPASLITVTDTRYLYDALGRLDAVQVYARNGALVDVKPETPTVLDPEVTDYVYDLLGNLDQVRGPNGVIADYDYDGLNRLEFLRHFRDDGDFVFDSGDSLLAEFDYDLLADGRRAGVTETISDGVTTTVNDIDWFYDAVGRLTRESYNSSDDALDYVTDYLFDLVGNRREKETDTDPDWAALAAGDPRSPNEKVISSYDANDRLLTEIAQSLEGTTWVTDRTTWHEYDPDADQLPGTGGSWTMETRKTVFQGSDTDPATRVILSDAKYSYNLQNRLSKAMIDSDGDGPNAAATVEYGYDAAGIRVHKIEGTDKVLYLVDHHNPTGYAQVSAEIAVAQQVQQLLRSYTFGLTLLSQAEASGQTYRFLLDGHNSTRALLTPSGLIIPGQVFAYDAYGNAHGFDPALTLTAYQYNAEPFDQHLLMQYLRGRWYDLATGRFNRSDPFFGDLNDPLSLHKYLYVHGDPIHGIDPTGKVAELIGMFISLAWQKVQSAKKNAADFATYNYLRVSLRIFSHIARSRQLASGAWAWTFYNAQVMAATSPLWLPRIQMAADVLEAGLTFMGMAADALHFAADALDDGIPDEHYLDTLAPAQRGVRLEDTSGANVTGNVKGIDDARFVAPDRAFVTSIRSHDAADPESLAKAIRSDANELFSKSRNWMTGRDRMGSRVEIDPAHVQGRGLLVVIPWDHRHYLRSISQTIRDIADTTEEVVHVVPSRSWRKQ